MFKKDEYIVLLGTTEDAIDQYSSGYVYKQREDNLYLRTYVDDNLSINNGWDSYCFNKKKNFDWRYATEEEIIAYENAGKPININEIIKQKEKMRETIINVLEKTYNSSVLRKRSVPLFMSNPGMGKSTIIKEFAESKGVNMKKLTLSQRMPNEVSAMVMPNTKTHKLDVYDSHELNELQDGDILFIDEVFNGTLKQTLDAFLNILEDRILPSGKKLANIMIVAASNPQGLINITPQIKERFIRYDLKFNDVEFQEYLKDKYGMPENISKHLCLLINKEKFEHDKWNYITPRSVEKAINQIGNDLESPYSEILLPFLSQEINSPMDIVSLNIKEGESVKFIDLLKLIVKNNNV